MEGIDPFRGVVGVTRELDAADEILSRFLQLAPHAPDGLISHRTWRPPTQGVVVGHLFPASFPAYGRLMHPMFDNEQRRVRRWRDVLGARQLEEVGSRSSGQALEWIGEPIAGFEPMPGHLDADSARSVADVITRTCGKDTESLFMFWGGTGLLGLKSDAVYRGPVEAVDRFLVGAHRQYWSPSVWWAASETWCVSTHTDFVSTYIGGSKELIRSLTEDHSADVLPADVDSPVDDYVGVW